MAHTKTGAAVKGNRDSIAKRLGVKKYGGEKVSAGNILVRQRGTKIHAGCGTYLGKDYTVMAGRSGKVVFSRKKGEVYINIV